MFHLVSVGKRVKELKSEIEQLKNQLRDASTIIKEKEHLLSNFQKSIIIPMDCHHQYEDEKQIHSESTAKISQGNYALNREFTLFYAMP